MHVLLNGFWHGFAEQTDGVHFGMFRNVLSRVFECDIELTTNVADADILLESHCSPSRFHEKKWRFSFFFSGEGSMTLPNHAEQYSAVLGALTTQGNHVKCPLFLVYDVCTPFTYSQEVSVVPPKGVCAIITSDQDPTKRRFRTQLVDELQARGIHIDMGGSYKNSIGYKVPGEYYEAPILAFQSQYRVVLALENTKSDEYITEKVLNPIRAGTIPVYYGSDRVTDYINPDRFVRVSDIDTCVADIQRLCTDDEYWLQMVHRPAFVHTLEQGVARIVSDIKERVFDTSYAVEIICNPEKEAERMTTVQILSAYYGVTPSTTCYGEDALAHPLYSRFNPAKGASVISLAINHVAMLEKYAQGNRFLVVFESDAIPLVSMDEIDAGIRKDIQTMRDHDIEFAFIGIGCLLGDANVYSNPENKVSDTLYFPRHLTPNGASRCTESYIVSPNGMRSFLAWFSPRVHHDAIDWTFNHYFAQNPNALGCWRNPELFSQGSYPSLLHETRLHYLTNT